MPHTPVVRNDLIDEADYAMYVGYSTPTDPVKKENVLWAIGAASHTIQQFCGRRFIPVASSVRYFDADGTRWLDIDDATAVTEIAVDSSGTGTYTVLDGSGYQLVAVAKTVELDGPYVAARRVGPYFWPGATTRINTVRVTAAWGWTSVPEPIKRACAVYAQDLLRDPEAAFGGILATAEGIAIGSRMPRRVVDLCVPYRRMDVVGGIA